MSSMFNEAFENMFQQYINEIVAVGLFSIGYYIFQKIQPCESLMEESEKKDNKSSNNRENDRLFKYNQYLRDSMYSRQDFDPKKILKEMKEQNLKPDITTLNTLMNVCVEQGKFNYTEELFEEIKREGIVKVNNISYNVMLKQLVHMSMRNQEEEEYQQLIDQAHSLLQEMKNNNIKVNFITYNTILDLYIRVNKFNQGVDYLYKITSEDDFQPDMFCYTTLIKGIRQKTNDYMLHEKDNNQNISSQKISNQLINKNWDIDIFKLYRLIQLIHDKYSHQIQIEQILFSCLIDLSFKMSYPKMAIKLFDEMKRQNIQIKLVTYGIIIKGFGNLKNSQKVQEYYNELIDSGMQINEATLGCLVNALVRCNKQDQAYDLVQNNLDIINTIIYTTLLTGFAKKKDIEMINNIFNQMQDNKNAQPNLVTYNALLDSLIQCNKYDQMEKTFEQIVDNFQPDIITYSTYLKGLCRNKQSLKAYEIYLKLKQDSKYQLDEVFFNLLLDGLGKDKQYEKAKSIYKDMIEMNVQPGIVTFSILIKLNSMINNLDECQNLWHQIKELDLRPSLICYTCMIQVYIKQKKMHEMYDIYQEMKKLGVQPDQIFYNSLLSGFIYNRKIQYMNEIILETIQNGFILGNFIYNNSIKLLSEQLNEKKSAQEYEYIYNDLLKMLNFVRSQQIDIDDDLYNKITNQMCKYQINLKINQSQSNSIVQSQLDISMKCTNQKLNKNLPKDYTFNRNYYKKQAENN